MKEVGHLRSPTAEQSITVYSAGSRSSLTDGLQSLWARRGLLFHLVRQDLQKRYRASFLGFVWTLLNPLLLTLVLWLVFKQFGRGPSEKNYAMFLLAGVMIYNFFSQAVSTGQLSLVASRPLLLRSNVPKLIFPVRSVLSLFVHMLFFLVVYLALLGIMGIGYSWSNFAVLGVLPMIFALSAGAGIGMAIANSFFRDFEHLTGILLRLLFYLTPIIYPLDFLGPRARALISFNPLVYPVMLCRDSLYYQVVSGPEVWALGYSMAALTLLLGLVVFSATENKLIYYI
ncbi:MAG: ABC transporter permease [Myxococcota bacterium]